MRLEFEQSVHPDVIPVMSEPAFEPTAALKKGISAAQAGDRVLARQLLEQVVRSDEHSAEAWMWLASIAEYPEELLACLDNVLDIDPGNERAADWHRTTLKLLAKTFVDRANAALAAGDRKNADRFFTQAIGNDEDSAAAWLGKALLTDDEEKKVGLLERVLAIDPENVEARTSLDAITAAKLSGRFSEAKAAAARGDNAAAIEILSAVLDADDQNIDAWMLRSHLSSDVNDKLSSLEKVLAIQPENATARASYDFLSSTLAADAPSVIEEEGPALAVEMPAEEPAHLDPFQTIAGITVEPEPSAFGESEVYVQSERDTESELQAAPEQEEVVMSDEERSYADVITEESFHVPAEPESDPIVLDDILDPVENSLQGGAYLEADAEAANPSRPCPYCWESNEPQAFHCSSCCASLTLSDIESLIHNPRADRGMIQTAVTQMEAEWNLREFSADELITLGIGHFNLGNFSPAIKYLQEASLLRPNDVILSGQINTLVIRLDEVRRQNELNESRPKGRTILVVDDSTTVRKLIAGKLEKSGHTVICAEDGVEGLAKIRECVPDLVLLDITMPRMDGYEVCRQIRSSEESKDIPVVMISGKDGFFDKVRGRIAGTTAYITKPFGPETLMKALETYLSGDPVHALVPEMEEEPVAA